MRRDFLDGLSDFVWAACFIYCILAFPVIAVVGCVMMLMGWFPDVCRIIIAVAALFAVVLWYAAFLLCGRR